ncbi:MAG: phage major capsid protein [Hoeflea sp.]|uniref:phage major capsid protein n=1 Tax=Hoeflea sp. TaxID=1940281 RepID=UPI001DABBD3B|nr:phage major capsid protein [Hoeflea sp.]MBU4528853.1 phage major capsid protein [Alphaproteobacteria bacterium]MBU4543986.1 phage major capsid protein [Alphaproteobacteria bacterium]MBU4551855.1 phage major capsid protein [Alphaproteobacteria bacterium]MBV1723320.1 phage major capsid protein [Hoeflea sp.]MBV1760299.1 phage major capsid protein [Hoeflea sp.]
MTVSPVETKDTVPPEYQDHAPSSGIPLSLVDAFDDFMTGFEEYKSVNEERLAQLEARKPVDALTEEKLRRIDDFMNAQQSALFRNARPLIGKSSAIEDETRAAMDAYVRKGRTEGYEQLESKGMSVGSEADGGYLVPDDAETAILSALKDESPMRSLAATLTISSSLYKRPFAISGAGAGWVAETAARPQTAAPQLDTSIYRVSAA